MSLLIVPLLYPDCTYPLPGYCRSFRRFLRSASCSSMVTMRRSGDRNVVARNRSNMVCKSTSSWAAARSNAASVPITFNPRCRAIATPSRSSINKRIAWSSDAISLRAHPRRDVPEPNRRAVSGSQLPTMQEAAKSTRARGRECLHGPARPSPREGSKPFDTVLEEYRLLG